MSLIAFPTLIEATGRRRLAWLAIPAVAVLAGLAYFAAMRSWGTVGAGSIPAAQVYTILPKDFEVTVNQRGELQSSNNIDIICQVEGQTTIQTIVNEGAAVKKGDVLVTL